MRDFEKLQAEIIDILIIGGGAHGATAAYHASKAGYKVALVEKSDFCNATSANSLKIIHGGLRYLQHGNIKRMRHSILARREMMQIAPHLIQPLACVMPTTGRGLRGKRLMQLALFLNDCISWDRNKELPAEKHLPGGHVITAEKCRKIIPGITGENLSGGAVWYDAMASNTERLILEYILESTRFGALACNYARAEAITKKDDDLYHVTVSDMLSQKKLQVTAKGVINAAGPWFERLIQGNAVRRRTQRWAFALNLVSKKKIFQNYAVALEGVTDYEDKDALVKRGKRLYFFVPWRDYTMIGTEYEIFSKGPDTLEVNSDLIQKMVDNINSIYNQANLKFEDISYYHAGLMPIQDNSDRDSIQLEKNSSFWEHSKQNYERVISIRGVKFTTAPFIASEVVSFLKTKIEPSLSHQVQEEQFADASNLEVGLRALLPILKERYGPRADKIFTYMSGEAEDIWVDEDYRLLKAEVRYLIEEEMACRLSDVVLRRTGIGSGECPGYNFLRKVSDFMGDILEWDNEQRKREIEETLSRYKPLSIEGNIQ